MFDALTDKFNAVVKSLSGRGRITEANISDALREVRKALLEADVNYNVAKQFVKSVKDEFSKAEFSELKNHFQSKLQNAKQELFSLRLELP